MAITRDEADRLLATIGAVYDRLATAMYAVDSHPTLTYLRAAMYTGRTNQMREAVLFDVGVMWAQFTTIGDILEQARALRSQFRPSDARWIDLDRLLAGPVVAVDNAGLPVTVSLAAGQRGGNTSGAGFIGSDPSSPVGSAGPGRIVGAVRVGDLAMGLQTRCAAATRRLEETGRAANAAAAAVAALTASMTALSDLARGLGDDGAVAPLEQRTALLREQVLSRSVDVRAERRGGRRDPAGGHGTRRRHRDRDRPPAYGVGPAGQLPEPDRGTARRRGRARRGGGARPRPRSCARPRRSPRPGCRRRRTRRPCCATASVNWTGCTPSSNGDGSPTTRPPYAPSTDRAIERARELRAAADGLVARRDELRGRLDGYRAKAATYRLDEHDDLGPLHVQARTLLYTAPCDLSAATKAVVAYQTTLAGLLGAGPITGGNEATR